MNSYAILAARWCLVELQAKRLNLICEGKENTAEFQNVIKSIADIEKHIDFCEGLTNE
tara:strand:- start:800 stop:973 length:174 start_codon:yes stop_codon:yes gene_type:complete